MKKIYITFSGDRYDATTRRIVEDAPKFGADRVLVYDDHWLKSIYPSFMRQNAWLFSHHATRGFGWFAWKPFIIMHALDNFCADRDIVLYTDADTYPITDLGPLYRTCVEQDGHMLFAAQGCMHRQWCKRDTFLTMAQDSSDFNGPEVQHGVGRFMLFQRLAGDAGWLNRQFLMEWQTYCLNRLANTFDKSVLAEEYSELREPRCEQAIMTNLAHKYGWKLWREACQFGAWSDQDRDRYGQVFEQVGDHTYAKVKTQEGSEFRNIP